MMSDLQHHLRQILTPQLCLSVYHLKFPFEKRSAPSGAVVGQSQFRPSHEYLQAFYDLIYHQAVLPLSKLPLGGLLDADLTELLPAPTAPDYPQQCLGMVTTLDQCRNLTTGYGLRYTRAFFDPVCEKLARQLIALPEDIRPDGKRAWLSRGYSFDDWLFRGSLWIFVPLVHSDVFMTADRQVLKDWLHAMRGEVERHCGYSDPFASTEAEDDVDIHVFGRIEAAGPPLKSYNDPEAEATIADYAFWWIRILNAHFAITDMCGHYPYWVRWTGKDWSEKDVEYMEKTNYHRYNPADEPFFELVKQDYFAGTWRVLETNPEYERQGLS